MGNPYKTRADGEKKGLAVHRELFWLYPFMVDQLGVPPSPTSAERTRSPRWLLGTRRTKRIMRKYRSTF